MQFYGEQLVGCFQIDSATKGRTDEQDGRCSSLGLISDGNLIGDGNEKRNRTGAINRQCEFRSYILRPFLNRID